ncbi:hypothetical protein J3E68DRAFT_271238 [Trichoderma sp. SZMC 28012]
MTISITTNTLIPTFGVVAPTSWHQKSTVLRSNAIHLKSIDHSILATLRYQHIMRPFSATPLQHKYGLDHIRPFTTTVLLKKKEKKRTAHNPDTASEPNSLPAAWPRCHPLPSPVGGQRLSIASASLRTAQRSGWDGTL